MSQGNKQEPPAGSGPLPSSREAAEARYGRRWLFGIALVTACSWARLVATGSPKVDENAPSELVGSLLLLTLLVGYGMMVTAWRWMLQNPPARPRRLAFAGFLVSALMLPMISNDVFSLFVYGSVAGRGHDLYTTAIWLPTSPFYRWMGQMWNQTVCVYGPTTLMATLPARLAGNNPWLALLLLRLAWLAPTALVMELSFRQLQDRPFFHAMVWLNPLWIVEGPGQLHTDMLGLVAVTAGILLQLGGRVKSGWVVYAVAALGKYSFVFTGFWFWLFGTRTVRERVVRAPAILAVLFAVGVVSFSVFWQGPKTLTEPVRALAGMNPGGSIVEIVGQLVHILAGGGISQPDLPARMAVAAQRASMAGIWFALSLVMRAFATCVAARALYVMLAVRRKEAASDRDLIALGTGVLVVAVLTLASHRFQSWYLLAAIPFFGLHCTAAWQKWWVAIVGVSVTVSFIHVLPKSAFLVPVWGTISNTGVILLFLTGLKARYWSFGTPEPRPGEIVASRGEAIAPGAPSLPQAGS
jgi:hypothetical protein